MTIKTWYQRLEAMDDGHITTHEDVRNAQQAEIDELRAALKAKPAFVQARAQLEKEWCELNAMKAALKAQPAQKPLPYWYTVGSDGLVCLCASEDDAIYEAKKADAEYPRGAPRKATRLYISAPVQPVQPAPLTDEQIDAAVMFAFGYINNSCRKGMRKAIEAAIKGGAT